MNDLAQIERVTTPVSLRRAIRAAYPALDKEPAYWRLLQCLLYGTFRDEVTQQPILTQHMLATLEDRQADLVRGRYAGRDLLERFSRDVFPITYSGYSVKDQRARCVDYYGLDPTIAQAVQEDLRAPWTPDGRVYFDSGRSFTRKSQMAVREASRAHALRFGSQAGCPEANALIQYLNLLSPHRFTKALHHLDATIAVACQLAPDILAQQQLRILRHIAGQPLPLYQPTDRSVRVFPFGESIVSLKRDIRAVLCQDWQGFDLRSAQLAICAADWGVTEVRDFLESGGNIWTNLFTYFNWTPDDTVKTVLKAALYAALFGAGEQRIVETFKAAGFTADQAQRFLAHPLLHAMWQARQNRLGQIRRDGGARDCFGRWIPMPWDHNPTTHRPQPNAPSVLAQLAQAMELHLMYPLIALAQRTDEFTIALWLHDGCYLDFKNSNKAARWARYAVDAVNNQAQKLGIATCLEPKM
jgi:hypothetical protein